MRAHVEYIGKKTEDAELTVVQKGHKQLIGRGLRSALIFAKTQSAVQCQRVSLLTLSKFNSRSKLAQKNCRQSKFLALLDQNFQLLAQNSITNFGIDNKLVDIHI